MTGRLILETERLLLYEFDDGDAEAFYPLVSNPEILRFTLDPGGGVNSVEQALEMLRSRSMADYRKHGFGRLAVVEKASGQLIGFAGLKYLEDRGEVDLGYRLLPTHWGRGFATESGRAILQDGFTRLGLTRIIATVFPENVASVRVLEKLGFVFEQPFEYEEHTLVQYVSQAPTRLCW